MVTYDMGPSLSPFVAEVIKEIRKHNSVRHEMTPMGSILEGSWSDILKLLDHLFLEFAPRYERLGINFKLDFRKSADRNRIKGKVDSVEKKIGKNS
ncbi:MAG: thiamine-binding protein [bacterium]